VTGRQWVWVGVEWVWVSVDVFGSARMGLDGAGWGWGWMTWMGFGGW